MQIAKDIKLIEQSRRTRGEIHKMKKISIQRIMIAAISVLVIVCAIVWVNVYIQKENKELEQQALIEKQERQIAEQEEAEKQAEIKAQEEAENQAQEEAKKAKKDSEEAEAKKQEQEESEIHINIPITKEEAWQLILDNLKPNQSYTWTLSYEDDGRGNANWIWLATDSGSNNIEEISAWIIDENTINVVHDKFISATIGETIGEYTLERTGNFIPEQQQSNIPANADVKYSATLAKKGANGFYVDDPPIFKPLKSSDGHIYKMVVTDTELKVWGRLKYSIPATGEEGTIEVEGKVFKIDGNSKFNGNSIQGDEYLKKTYSETATENAVSGVHLDVQGDTLKVLSLAG